MFQEAANLLNKCGFKITVRTDPQALIKLASGGLQVWAAAWSSPIDPDMYQVYHRDSTATSVKNWGYPTIMANSPAGQFTEENTIINDLAVLIEKGRETINVNERKETYAKALDKVMELCVELPTYQRKELAVYNKNLIDANSLNENPTWMAGVVNEIWKLNFN
jgi:peptide/nickel transport system substrate-binding protein